MLFRTFSSFLPLHCCCCLFTHSVVDNQGEVGHHTGTEIESGITWLHAAMGYTSATKGTWNYFSLPVFLSNAC